MTLSEIATISGKGGLFKVLAPTKSGVILESLDEAKSKMVATTSHKLSLLNEISIYTTTKEGTVGLEDRVYISDIKKLVKWYGSILKFAPELFTASTEAETSKETLEDATSKEKAEETEKVKKEKEEKK
jgi:hypothetical protein